MNDSPALRERLHSDLQTFAATHPEMALVASEFQRLLADPAAFLRERLAGHFTGSAWLVSADGARVLLMHHRKLDRWLQPGGHADGDADLAAVALREAEEETGLRDLHVESGIFDIDAHRIPARGDVPEHTHYDVRYVIRTYSSEVPQGNEESLALAWVDIAALRDDPVIDPSIRRMARCRGR
ncbi:MAG TPA: NUDIX hydrolase [Aquimonas sp.]|nr:NUDIX hydrolase [Aquimonas sp.]